MLIRVEQIPANWATGPGAHPSIAPRREHQNVYEPPPLAGLRARRNKRSWWLIASEPFPGAHFATFPQALVEPCVLAGTSERGCCPSCGLPWARELERLAVGSYHDHSRDGVAYGLRQGGMGPSHYYERPRMLGWRPSCRCAAGEPVPCVVLDPFVGSGTVAYVAHRLGRRAIGIDAKPEYIEMARRRLATLPVRTLS